jgi:arsenite methyltransferase
VLSNAALRSGDKVLDVGTGTGLLTIAAAEQVKPDGDVFAVDVSVDALEELQRICTAPNVFYFVGTAEVLPLVDDGVDVVLTRSVLIYVDDKAEAAREFYRVLRPGGRISIFEPINSRNTRLSAAVDFGDVHQQVEDWERAAYEDPGDPMLNFNEDDLERMFKAAGFEDVQMDLREGESEASAERMLTAVGAPGRLSLADAWAKQFSADVTEKLVAAMRAAGTVRRAWPQLYLSARKP